MVAVLLGFALARISLENTRGRGFCGVFLEVLWRFYGGFMEVSWRFYGGFISLARASLETPGARRFYLLAALPLAGGRARSWLTAGFRDWVGY